MTTFTITVIETKLCVNNLTKLKASLTKCKKGAEMVRCTSPLRPSIRDLRRYKHWMAMPERQCRDEYEVNLVENVKMNLIDYWMKIKNKSIPSKRKVA